MVRSNQYILAGSKGPLVIIFPNYLRENDCLLNLGSGCLFQLLPEPFHGEHLQTPDRLPQGEISLLGYLIQLEQNSPFRYRISKTIFPFQDIRFNQIRALLDYMYHGEVCQISIHYGISKSHMNNRGKSTKDRYESEIIE